MRVASPFASHGFFEVNEAEICAVTNGGHPDDMLFSPAPTFNSISLPSLPVVFPLSLNAPQSSEDGHQQRRAGCGDSGCEEHVLGAKAEEL